LRSTVSSLAAAVALSLICGVPAEAGAIRISQIYPGGGGDDKITSPYQADFLELFNATGSPVDVGGWMLAYGGSNPTSVFGCAGCNYTFPASTVIAPCSYLLIQGTQSFNYGSSLTTPDVAFSSLDLHYGGALGLLSSGTPSGTCLSGPGLEDLVGWTASCAQGSAAYIGTAGHALTRLGGGMTSAGNNSTDFVESTPTPRNSASPQNAICVQTPTLERSWGSLKVMYR
jgi:hypothetical protein